MATALAPVIRSRVVAGTGRLRTPLGTLVTPLLSAAAIALLVLLAMYEVYLFGALVGTYVVAVGLAYLREWLTARNAAPLPARLLAGVLRRRSDDKTVLNIAAVPRLF